MRNGAAVRVSPWSLDEGRVVRERGRRLGRHLERQVGRRWVEEVDLSMGVADRPDAGRIRSVEQILDLGPVERVAVRVLQEMRVQLLEDAVLIVVRVVDVEVVRRDQGVHRRKQEAAEGVQPGLTGVRQLGYSTMYPQTALFGFQ